MATTVDIATDGSSGRPYHGHQVVGLVRKQLTLLGPGQLIRGIVIKAPGPNDANGGNSVPVYIGSEAVTANSNEGTGGISIAPGESLSLPALDPSKVYVIASAEGQDVGWLGI